MTVQDLIEVVGNVIKINKYDIACFILSNI